MEGQNTTAKTKFTWKIPNFSRLVVKKMPSDIFIAGGCKWRVLVFPKGNNVDYLSLYLEVADSAELPKGWNRDAWFSLAVINQFNNTATIRKETRHVFNAKENDWGFTSFIPLKKLKSTAERYLVRDTLTVEAEVLVHSVVHYSKIETEKQASQLDPNKAPEPPVEAPPNQTALTKKPTVNTVEPAPLASQPLSQSKATDLAPAEEVKKPLLALPPPPIEPVKSPADVQTKSKGLITQLLRRKKSLKSRSNNEISVPSEVTSPDIQKQQKEALKGFFNMSLEALQQANCFANIENILQTLAQHTDNLQEKTTLEDIMSFLAEFRATTPNAKAVVETAQAHRASLAGKTAELDMKLEQKQKELSSLESEFSLLSEEEAKIQAEIERLMAKKEEIVIQKKSVSVKLEKANEETDKEIEEWRNLEKEMKKANLEWLEAKEKLAAANVRWKLFREDLGLGKLNIS